MIGDRSFYHLVFETNYIEDRCRSEFLQSNGVCFLYFSTLKQGIFEQFIKKHVKKVIRNLF